MKKQRLLPFFTGLVMWAFSAAAAPENVMKSLESTVPPEPYHAIRKPDWVHGCNDSKHPNAQLEYKCMKVAVPPKIDGKLDEWIWRTAPEMHFVGYVNKSEPPFPTWAKVLWDDQYLYVAFHFEEPDIRAYWTLNSSNAMDAYVRTQEPMYPKRYLDQKNREHAEQLKLRHESRIMYIDRFAKIFLDPDGDGVNYLETHINPLGNTFTCWFELPSQGCRDLGIDYNDDNHLDLLFAMPGMKHAVHVDGTINNPNDIDNSWTIEVALPWETLKNFSVKKRAPLPGEAWGLHLARVYRRQINASNEYWGWPFLDICSSHQTEKYGKLRFVDHPGFKSFFSLDLPRDAEGIALAARMGVKQAAVPTDYPESSRKCAAENGIHLFSVVSMLDRDASSEPVWQKLSPEQERFFAAQEGRDIDPACPQHDMHTRGFRDSYGYRYGSAPGCLRARRIETFAARVLCPSSPENREAIKKRIRAICERKDCAGIFLEGIGWQNYIDCKCPLCSSVKDKKSIWMDFINEMTDHVKSLRPDLSVVVHLFPGTVLSVQDADACHADRIIANIAWYDNADLWDLRKQAEKLGEKSGKLIPATAVGDIVTDLNILAKSPERIDLELSAIARGGSGTLAIKGFDCLLRHPELYQVFFRYWRP